ncbi:MAG: GLUG motif-containing protein, partial [Coriobacteriales bacterium]
MIASSSMRLALCGVARWGLAAAMAAGLVTGAVLLLAPQAQAAEPVAISSVEDFKKIDANPAGSYYLANNIDFKGSSVTVCSSYYKPFTGSFDGRGRVIKNYSLNSASTLSAGDANLALFGYAEGATFKNVTFANFSCTKSLADDRGYFISSLLAQGRGACSISGVTVKGTMKISGSAPSFVQAGGVAASTFGSVSNCTSQLAFSYKNSSRDGSFLSYGGVTGIEGARGSAKAYTVKNCTNKAAISVDAVACSLTVCGVAGTSSANVSGCTNSGKISVTVKNSPDVDCIDTLSVGGVCGTAGNVASCANSGSITVKSAAPQIDSNNVVGGVVQVAQSVSKCRNTGAISYAGKKCGEGVGGVVFSAGTIKESFNTGKLSVSGGSALRVGGLAGKADTKVTNCYNTGTVSFSGSKHAGGLLGDAGICTVSSCYSTGAVSAKGGAAKYSGQVVGWYEAFGKRGIKQVYCTKAGKATGEVGVTSPSLVAQVKKVSSISFGNCPGLSSKYWAYSAKK